MIFGLLKTFFSIQDKNIFLVNTVCTRPDNLFRKHRLKHRLLASSVTKMATGIWAMTDTKHGEMDTMRLRSLILCTNLKVCNCRQQTGYLTILLFYHFGKMFHLETNPLALGRDWESDENSHQLDVTVYIFDNKEDYKKEWP